VVGWFDLGTEAVSFGMFGATEKFEILRPIVPSDAIFVMDVFAGDGVESPPCDHHESVNHDGIRRLTVV
jgi:hypothetical protein